MKHIKPLLAIVLVAIVLFGIIATFNNLPDLIDTGTKKECEENHYPCDKDHSNNGNNEIPTFNILTQQIIQLQENIKVLENERNSVVEELLNSQLSNELKEQLIYELENNIANMQVYIRELNNMILDLQAENAELKAYIVELEEIRDSLLQACFALEQLVETLNQGLLEYRFGIVFMFNDTIYSVQMIPVDGKIQIQNPVSTDYVVFLGWSLSLNGALVDISQITVTSDMTFYAVITRKYNVNFVYENNSHGNFIVEMGNTRTVTNPANTDRKIFLGWTLNGVDIVNPATRQIFEHTTWFAKVETRHFVTFAYKRNDTITNISTQYVATANGITVPTTLTFAGYSFGGWTLNQSAVSNPRTITLNGDVTFFAKYTPTNQTVASANLPTPQNSLNQNITNSGNYRVERVFFNLDHLIDTSQPLDSMTVTVKLEFPTVTRTVKVTLTSFHDMSYRAQYSGGRLDVFNFAVFHKSNAVSSSGIPLGTHIICFDTWVDSSGYRIPPENCYITITAITFKYADNFKY
ncbi:MAG: InlB B-repeat-containing protein [Firmicutes bacterium]|nr:InlB B-repeat-containing protein [Bacillota bacterium]